MGEEAIPKWAAGKARSLADAETTSGDIGDEASLLALACYRAAFARYIASHEEPPVDPLLIEAREIVAQAQHDWPDNPWHLNEAAELRAGNRDYTLVLKGTLAGLRRGVEIGREEGQ